MSRAVILAGGLGTRLRPYTFTVPKPLLPLGNRALLDHLIAQLVRGGVTQVVIALGYQAQLVRAYFGDGERFGTDIEYVEEHEPLGTAGCLALVRPLLGPGEPFFLVNGDIFTRLDFNDLARFHEAASAQLTIGYIEHTYQSPFGVLEFDGIDIVGVVEKPAYTHPVSAGIYRVSAEAAALVAKDRRMTMPELAMAVRQHGGRVVGYPIKAFWRALERVEHFEEMLQHDLEMPLDEESDAQSADAR